MIRAGRVIVDGAVATIGQKVDPSQAQITVDGLPLPTRPDAAYYLLYKPVGVISTSADEHGRATVVDLVPPEPKVYPVGRLDADSEGLLILTNDGTLTHHVTHPRFGVTKTYTALTTGRLTPADMSRLEAGVALEDGMAAAVAAKLVDVSNSGSLIEIVMAEGRNREVRRMVAALGEKVVRLVRTAIADLRDRSLRPGEWRHLDIGEIRGLFAAGVHPPAWDNGSGQAVKEPSDD